MKRSLLLVVLLFAVVLACKKKKEEPKPEEPVVSDCPDSSGTISYSTHIVPITTSYCGKSLTTCHGAGAAQANFNSYAGFTGYSANQIKHAVKQDAVSSYTPMPKNAPKLSQCNISKIVNWVNQGMNNN